jgi:hypothetical protein
MSKQIDFLKRCIALNLQSGGLLDLLDRIEELERDLLNLVCRIHRDGGHYIAKYGEAKAIADADIVAAQNNADLDTLQADNARLREALKEIRDNFDCDNDAHRYGSTCRCCLAEKTLDATPEQSLAAYRNKELTKVTELERERDTAWAQAHRLALELECLIMDTKDNAVVSKWWDSAFEAIEEYQALKPGADEEAEAWAKMRKAGI